MDCRITIYFDGRLQAGASAADLAVDAARAWRGVERRLSPVLGARGLDSLARRCELLVSAKLPWFVSVSDPGTGNGRARALELVLSRQTAADAARTATLFLTTLTDLLTSLVGQSLTDRLLGPVWAEVSSERDSQGENA